jgi:hypothetical protein
MRAGRRLGLAAAARALLRHVRTWDVRRRAVRPLELGDEVGE